MTKLNIAYVGFGEQDFQRNYDTIFKAMQERMPNMEFAFQYQQSGKGALKQLLAESEPPDLILSFPFVEDLQVQADAVYPLDKENLDIPSLNPGLVAYLRSIDPSGRLIGIPTTTQYYGLFYNKAAFDYFKMDVPGDNLTWGQLLDIAEKMAKAAEQKGYTYNPLSLAPNMIQLPLEQLAMRYTDSNTGKVLFTSNPDYRKYLELVKRYFSLPGTQEAYGLQKSINTKPLSVPAALHIGTNSEFQQMSKNAEQWKQTDVAPIPIWEANPDTAPYAVPLNVMIIPRKSAHKNEAVAVMKQFIGKDMQTRIARNPGPLLVPVITDSDVLKLFGADDASYREKKVKAFFAKKAAQPLKTFSRWDPYRETDGMFAKFLELHLDIPAYLQYLTKASEDKISQAMAGQGQSPTPAKIP